MKNKENKQRAIEVLIADLEFLFTSDSFYFKCFAKHYIAKHLTYYINESVGDEYCLRFMTGWIEKKIDNNEQSIKQWIEEKLQKIN